MKFYPFIKILQNNDDYSPELSHKPVLGKSIFGLKSTSNDEEVFRIEKYKYEQSLKDIQDFQLFSNTYDFESHKFNLQLGIFNNLKSIPNAHSKKSNLHKSKAKQAFNLVLNKWFTNYIRTDLTLGDYSSNRKQPYWTDFVYFDSKLNLYVDIEIDHPYELIYDSYETHILEKNYIGENNYRDNFFNKNGWFVIRFSEEQIVKYPESCCKYIGKLLFQITFNFKYINDFYHIHDLPKMPMWTKSESNYMAKNKYRDLYLKPNLFNVKDKIKLKTTNKVKFKIKYDVDTNNPVYILRYDVYGNIIEELRYDTKNALPIKRIKSHYEEGKIVEKVFYDFDFKNKIIPIFDEFIAYEYENNLLEAENRYIKGNDYKKYNHIYDENNNLIEISILTNNKLITLLKKYYENNLLKKWDSFKDGIFEGSSIYSYDKDLNLIKIESYNIKNELKDCCTYIYNSKNQLLQEILDLKSINVITINKFDESGNKIETNSSGSFSHTDVFTYNSSNQIISESIFYKKNTTPHNYKYDYKYFVEEITIDKEEADFKINKNQN